MISGALCRRVAGARVPKAGRRSLRIVVEAEASSGAKERKASPLDRGGSLSGDLAAGKDAGPAATKALKGDRTIMKIIDGRFKDDRWDNKSGRWILSHPMFQNAEGETDWDLVLDAEIERRRMLEQTPIPSRNDDPVNFDTSEIPWWAWVKRFHLPEAEKLNGRAAMVGYFMALVVDQLTGAGLLDQQSSFLGKVALTVTVVGILLVRSMDDIDNYRGLIDEATFYDKQWNATWEGRTRPSETQE